MFCMGSKFGILLLAGAAAASVSSAAMADVLVTRSIGAAAREYPRGTRLADDAVIELERGDSVTILGRNGTRQFRTPGRWRVDGRRVLANGNLSRANASGLARTGVSRTGVGADGIPVRTVWQIEMSEPGKVCFVSGEANTIRRGSAEAPRELTVTRTSDGASRTVSFGESDWSQPWPGDFERSPDIAYEISYPGAVTPTSITFLPLAVDAEDEVAVGAALIENGCDAQFQAMMENAEPAG